MKNNFGKEKKESLLCFVLCVWWNCRNFLKYLEIIRGKCVRVLLAMAQKCEIIVILTFTTDKHTMHTKSKWVSKCAM